MQIAESLVCTEVQASVQPRSPHFVWIILNRFLITEHIEFLPPSYLLDLSSFIAKARAFFIIELCGGSG